MCYRGAGGSAGGGANLGDKVVVKLETWESRHVNPEGRIIEVLGPAHAPGIDMLSIIRKYQLAEDFPADVHREAERIDETVPPEEIARREDIPAHAGGHHRSG